MIGRSFQSSRSTSVRRQLLVAGIALSLVAIPAHTAWAQNDLFGGVGDIVSGALSIPYGVLAGTVSGPPVIGTVAGALMGALNTLSLTTRGVFRLLGVAIPLAAKVAPLLPIFL